MKELDSQDLQLRLLNIEAVDGSFVSNLTHRQQMLLIEIQGKCSILTDEIEDSIQYQHDDPDRDIEETLLSKYENG